MMKLNRRSTVQLLLVLSAIALLAARFRLNPDDPGDLFPVWIGTVEVLHGHNPYREEVSERIQRTIYGRALTNFEIEHGRDQHRFVYPTYLAFFLSPLSRLRYVLARDLFCGTLAILVALSIPLWLRTVGWRPPPSMVSWITVIVLLSPVASRGFRLVQVGLLDAFLLCLTAFAIKTKRLALGGVLLAMSSIKPQLAFLPTIWLLCWSLSRFRNRGRVLLGFFLTLGALVAGSEALTPGWISHFLRGMVAYVHYTSAPSALDATFGRPWSIMLAIPALISFSIFAWNARYDEPDSSRYVYALTLCFAVSVWVVPANFDPYNQLLCLPLLFALGRTLHRAHP